MVSETQMPGKYRAIIDDQVEIYADGQSIQVCNSIPSTHQIPLDDQNHWVKAPDVVCVYVDMVGSTQLSASTHDKSTAGAYQLFTGTAVRILAEFDPPYIDVRGDGAFALFNSDQVYRAIAAAVAFKTFAAEVFTPTMQEKTKLITGAHVGIDQKTLLVRRMGLRRHGGRTDRQNEVWAGKPVNMAAKLASKSGLNELLISDRYYSRITDDLVRMSCGCPDGQKKNLWQEVDVSNDDRFDFDSAYCLKSNWCKTHGAEYLKAILDLDDE